MSTEQTNIVSEAIEEAFKHKKKPKILLLSDDLRMNSGIATMSREIVLGTLDRYDWVQIGGAIKHPDNGKVVDMCEASAKLTGIKDAYVKIYPIDGYGNEDILFTIMAIEKPDAIMHFTDPRFWGWLYALERQIRSKIPLTYLNIWDDTPYPMYNRSFYKSCDLLMSISKQTMNINKWVIGQDECCLVGDPNPWGKHILHYVPHGINSKVFYPYDEKDARFIARKKDIFQDKKYDYMIFYNSRNINRKRTSNIILAYRAFCDSLPKEKADKCLLFLHTEPRHEAGTDLPAVKEALCPEYNIAFSPGKFAPEDMAVLYSIADVTVNISSNEGFGLSAAESLLCGTPIIVNVTGGLQDQIGQVDDDGKPVEFGQNFGSNNVGKYKNHGPWAYPIWPVTRMVQGSIPTPYIFDDICTWEETANAMMYWYLMSREQRKACGKKGREWALGEGGLNSVNMCNQFHAAMDYTLKNFKPIKRFDVFTTKHHIGHQMPDNCPGFEIHKPDVEKLKAKVEETLTKV
jgi:glycosyltransferase involved in cell wall biosynthesis